MAKSYVAGVLQGIKRLQGSLADMPTQTAYALLQSCLEDEPTPPWDSGDLRNSGAAYVGTRLVATTADFGEYEQNPKSSPNDLTFGRKTASGASILGSFRSRSREGAVKMGGSSLATFRDTVSVVFRTPYANEMHYGSYNPREPGSGPFYVSSKLPVFGKRFTEIARFALSNSSPKRRW